ncbi:MULTISPECIES: hypothetical protein [unclassified Mesorhizobium]|uniref:hypothetical protein n=1 Tax=unclassified Mesorhizobium TaxID=325217 RepID=UPI000BC682B3|nr:MULTISPECIES: hypothetical protein [unclassified Mesorhizobium]AZO08767.1 hypothetical protein EJ074_06310 [Mesorhizobium sp. M3A.F.Ca.ET.080.04.2.1]PBB84085.1 hypothetical protein CK216_25240 [Mesorhizobium sp. WSM3876]RWB72108.1 MAG: hypothetical protein EOQ49_12745 [Mesorhizobium sp.]RWB83687.1 MAG: hypothetical protein EOQ52_26135 [Mesorhizobium sp.]RWE23902.1 MAG: hypothetical protein EOS41_18370 [Mesorhizobium sp.]
MDAVAPKPGKRGPYKSAWPKIQIETLPDSAKLQALEKRLPRNARPGSAEATMLLLVYQEMEKRKR